MGVEVDAPREEAGAHEGDEDLVADFEGNMGEGTGER